MRDPILQDKMTRERERFVNSIAPESICQLASSHHNGDACTVFRSPMHGSFNVCFFVEFEPPARSNSTDSKGDRWVVRIPISARVPWVDEKLDVEIATMRYVSAKTTLPIPRLHAWSFSKDSPIGAAYIIMDYVEGKTLSQMGFPLARKWQSSFLTRSKPLGRVHEQLADVYIQLRQLEFPAIGALGLPPDSQTTKPPDIAGIAVRNRPMPVELLMQEVERRDPTVAFPPGKTFKTSTEYIDALLWLADNGLDKSKDSWLDSRDGRQVVYGAHDFKRYVTEEWVDKKLEDGPFVLMHGDLSFHASNLLWDENNRLVAILDWEWSHVVPAQFFVPPLWLTGFYGVAGLAQRFTAWTLQAQHLRRSVRKREKELGFPLRLTAEWRKMEYWPHTLIALAALRPETIYSAYWTFLAHEISGESRYSGDASRHQEIMDARMADFFEGSPSAQLLLDRKIKEQKEFDAEWEAYGKEMVDEPEDCQCAGCEDKRREVELREDEWEERDFNKTPELSEYSMSGGREP